MDGPFPHLRCTRHFFLPFFRVLGIFLILFIFHEVLGRVFSSRHALTLPYFGFLGPGSGWFLRFSSCRPPRPVSGLVWVFGPLICGTGHVFGVIGLGLGELWRIPCVYFPLRPAAPSRSEPGAI